MEGLASSEAIRENIEREDMEVAGWQVLYQKIEWGLIQKLGFSEGEESQLSTGKKKKKAEGEKVRDLKRRERVWSFHHGLQESKSSEKPQDGWAVLRRTHLKEVMVTRHWQQAAYCGIFSSRHGGSGATRDSRQLVSLWVGFLLRGDEKVRVGEGSLA